MTYIVPTLMCILNMAAGILIGRYFRTAEHRYDHACRLEYERLCETWAERTAKEKVEEQREKETTKP